MKNELGTFCTNNDMTTSTPQTLYQDVLAAPEGKQGSVQPYHGSSSRCLDGDACDSEQPLALSSGDSHHHPEGYCQVWWKSPPPDRQGPP
jgi:hypothetical protein